jgi:hypothetical protein
LVGAAPETAAFGHISLECKVVDGVAGTELGDDDAPPVEIVPENRALQTPRPIAGDEHGLNLGIGITRGLDVIIVEPLGNQTFDRPLAAPTLVYGGPYPNRGIGVRIGVRVGTVTEATGDGHGGLTRTGRRQKAVTGPFLFAFTVEVDEKLPIAEILTPAKAAHGGSETQLAADDLGLLDSPTIEAKR